MSLPKIAKDIKKDIEVTKKALWNLGVISEITGESITSTGNNSCNITWCTKNDSNNIFYDTNVSIDYLFEQILSTRQFSILFYDKSILQAEYMIKNGVICKQRLLFMKRHNRVWDKEEIKSFEEQEEVYFGDWFHDNEGIPILIRIDFDSDPKAYKECEHAMAHFHLSNHESCRIPLKGVVTFSDFVEFVMLHFYGKKMEVPKTCYFNETISQAEQEMLHIYWK